MKTDSTILLMLETMDDKIQQNPMVYRVVMDEPYMGYVHTSLLASFSPDLEDFCPADDSFLQLSKRPVGFIQSILLNIGFDGYLGR